MTPDSDPDAAAAIRYTLAADANQRGNPTLAAGLLLLIPGEQTRRIRHRLAALGYPPEPPSATR